MGIVPGVGEFLAQFFSYTFAQKTSRNPDLIGRGSPEGLIASEAANQRGARRRHDPAARAGGSPARR